MQEFKNNVFAQRVTSHPWWVILWEPVSTKVPGPHLTQAYCCYARTVIFYVRGYLLRPFSTPLRWTKWRVEKPNTRFEYWTKLETVFRIDDVFEYESESYEICGGSIVWYNKQWWCRYRARRKDTPNFNRNS